VQTIVLAARKGGSGKTTLAAHIAVQAQYSGIEPVTLIDLDTQRSLTAWWNDRKADNPLLLEVPPERLKAEILRGRPSPGLLVIDTPPWESSLLEPVLEVSDLVVIPVKPSPHDLRGVTVTVELCKRVHKPFVFVLNQAVQRATLTQQAPLVLSQFGPVATTIVYNRVDYAGAMTDGRTVMEVDRKSKAAIEVADVFRYLSQYLSSTVQGAA
jgi:chromosome partitioning protein